MAHGPKLCLLAKLAASSIRGIVILDTQTNAIHWTRPSANNRRTPDPSRGFDPIRPAEGLPVTALGGCRAPPKRGAVLFLANHLLRWPTAAL